MYLVTGSTGNIGNPLVDLLAEQGHRVRALVRNAARANRFPDGVDIAVGDLGDADSVGKAVRGVEGVFLLFVDPGTNQAEIMIEAARAAGVRKIVLLSSIGARLEPKPLIGEGLADREEVLRQSELDVTYLRPNTLMSNTLAWADPIRHTGRVLDSTGPGRMPCTDPEDIARVAALVLTQEGHAGHGFILNGPEALTSREQVDILADVLGRHIEFQDTTPEQFAKEAIAHGTPPDFANAVQDLNKMFRTGRAGVLSDDIENLTGLPPRTFRDWCQRHADAFR